MVEELFPDPQQILDFFHLCENVNTYAKCLFNIYTPFPLAYSYCIFI